MNDTLTKMTITEEQAKDILKYLVRKTGHLDDIYLSKNGDLFIPDKPKDKILVAHSKQTNNHVMVFIKTTDGDIFSTVHGKTYAECLKFMQDIMATHDARLRIVWYEVNLPRSLEELLIEMDLNE